MADRTRAGAEMTEPRLIPATKIANQRFGQLIYNALRPPVGELRDTGLADLLFYISNDDLEERLRRRISSPERTGGEA